MEYVAQHGTSGGAPEARRLLAPVDRLARALRLLLCWVRRWSRSPRVSTARLPSLDP